MTFLGLLILGAIGTFVLIIFSAMIISELKSYRLSLPKATVAMVALVLAYGGIAWIIGDYWEEYDSGREEREAAQLINETKDRASFNEKCIGMIKLLYGNVEVQSSKVSQVRFTYTNTYRVGDKVLSCSFDKYGRGNPDPVITPIVFSGG